MRVRIVLLVAATSSLVLVAFLVPLAVLVRSAAVDRATSSAVVEAQALAPAVATGDPAQLRRAIDGANAAGGHLMTVFLPGGTTVGAPAGVTAAVQQGLNGHSLTATESGGAEVVVAVSGMPGGTAVIRTFVPDTELEAGVAHSWLVLGLLGLGLLGLSLAVAVLLARSLTRPLSDVANVSYRLASGSLGARADDAGPPEVRQVSAGLNRLAERIADLLAQERATVADLSHRLRTPLTALRIDVEMVTDLGARSRLLADLDRVDRTVDDVIREADRPVREGAIVLCDAAVVVAERARFWSALADDEDRRMTVQVQRAALLVRLSEEDLSACVDALIGNVFAHTAVGVAFELSLSPRRGGGGWLVVADGGAGIADPGALQRGASGAGSTGLGLDIVRRAARRSGGDVIVDRGPRGGARFTVELGPPPPSIVRSHRDRRLIPER